MLNVRAIFLKAKNFITQNWWVLVLIAICVVWFSQQNTSVSQRLAEIDHAHKTEIEEFRKTREIEQREYAQNIKKLELELKKIQDKYDADIKQVEANKKKDTEKYVQKYTGNPGSLAQKVSELTGFPVYIGEQK